MTSMTAEEEEKWRQEIMDESDDEAEAILEDWLLPQTDAFFYAPSGHRLHIRAVLPPGQQAASIKGVLLYCHGLNSHFNGKFTGDNILKRLAAEGFAVFAVDIMGHGYSEGTRARVDDWNIVFDDLEGFLDALMGVIEPEPTPEEFHPGVSAQLLAHLRRLPLFVSGVSMGGMIAMFMGLRCQRSEQLQGAFKGVVMGCPSLAVDLPPMAVQVLLRNLVVPLFRNFQMPAIVSKSSKAPSSYSYDLSDQKQEEVAAMDIRDCALLHPGTGLGHCQGMLWATSGAFVDLFGQLAKDMKEVEFPFLILHDPADQVCFISGSEKLMELSPSKDKFLQKVDAGGRHCLPVVITDLYISSVTGWMRQRL